MARWMLCAFVLVLTVPVQTKTNAELREQVRHNEIAFDKSVADRDLAASTSFLARGAYEVARRALQ